MLTLHRNTEPCPDTFDAREYDELKETVQATYLGGDLLPTVQVAVTTARMTRGENWNAEARRLLCEFGVVVCCAAPMVATSSLTA